MTTVVLLKPYGAHSKGAVLSLPQSDVAAQLIRRGIARMSDSEAEEVLLPAKKKQPTKK